MNKYHVFTGLNRLWTIIQKFALPQIFRQIKCANTISMRQVFAFWFLQAVILFSLHTLNSKNWAGWKCNQNCSWTRRIFIYKEINLCSEHCVQTYENEFVHFVNWFFEMVKCFRREQYSITKWPTKSTTKYKKI